MVQSWENFMRPDGGAFEKDSILYGPAGIALSFGIDLVGQPLLNSLEKRSGRLIRDRLRFKNQTTTPTIRDDPRWGPSRKIKEQIKARLKGAYARKHVFKREMSLNTAKYAGLKSLARGISWGMLAVTAADMVEGMMTPGVDRMALQKDEQAVYGSGGTFLDSSQAYTQRKRALLAIHESQLGIRGILSQEASGFHK